MSSLYHSSSLTIDSERPAANPLAPGADTTTMTSNNTDVLLNKFLQNNDLNLLENYLNLSKYTPTCSPPTPDSQAKHCSSAVAETSSCFASPVLTTTVNTAATTPINTPIPSGTAKPHVAEPDIISKSSNNKSKGSRTTTASKTTNSGSTSKARMYTAIPESGMSSNITSCTTSISGGSDSTSPYSSPGSTATAVASPVNHYRSNTESNTVIIDDSSLKMLQLFASPNSNNSNSMEHLINEYQAVFNNTKNSILSLQKREKELMLIQKKRACHASGSVASANQASMINNAGSNSSITTTKVVVSKNPVGLADDLSVETFVKCNDLLFYYKIFNAICLVESNNSCSKIISCSDESVVKLFNAIIDFSNKVNPVLNSDSDDVNNIDDFDYDSLRDNQIHLSFKAKIHNFEPHGKDIDIANSLTLLIVKKYDSLNFKILNYFLYLCNNFKPNNNHDTSTLASSAAIASSLNVSNKDEDENESSLKKLKSCSRCRKNKIKCDSLLKFSYSCSNCFKKNINFIKTNIKRNFSLTDNSSNSATSNGPFSFFNNSKYSSESGSSLNSAKKPARAVSIKRSESVPSIPSLSGKHKSGNQQQTSDCGCGSVACDALHGSMNQDSDSSIYDKSEGQIDSHVSNLKLFLKLFNLRIIYSEDQNHYVLESLQSDQSMSNVSPMNNHNNNSTLINCKLQLISSNLLLKKKSMKKNHLINSLVSDINYLKKEIDLIVERESKLVDLLYSKSKVNDTARSDNIKCAYSVDYTKVKRILDQVELPNSKKRKC